jgi:superfamily II helicase
MFDREYIREHAEKHGLILKEVQLLSVENVLAKRDTMVIAKTGEGKSLIFQVACSIFNSKSFGIAVIVCPLVAHTANPWDLSKIMETAPRSSMCRQFTRY